MSSVYAILHPTDFSRCADKAYQAGCSMARDRGAHLIVLHVREPTWVSTAWTAVKLFGPAKAERWKALGKLQARESDVRIETMMRKGAPAVEILALASELPCDLLGMGMHGHAEEESSELGRVAGEVTSLAHFPVLAVKVSRRRAAKSGSEQRRMPNLRPALDEFGFH